MLECFWQACDWRPVSPAVMRLERAQKTAATKKMRWWEGEEKKKEKEWDIQLHIHLTLLPLLITLQRGAGNSNTFAHWHIRFRPPLRAYAQKENPLTLPGLLQILTGLSCKAGRHTETTWFNTVTLVCTLSLVPQANELLLDIYFKLYYFFSHLVYSTTPQCMTTTSSTWSYEKKHTMGGTVRKPVRWQWMSMYFRALYVIEYRQIGSKNYNNPPTITRKQSS